MALNSIANPISCIGNLLLFQDLLSSQLVVITLWLRGLIIIARQKFMLSRTKPIAFIFMVTSLTLVLIIAFYSSSLIVFYIFFEASLIPTLLLILG